MKQSELASEMIRICQKASITIEQYDLLSNIVRMSLAGKTPPDNTTRQFKNKGSRLKYKRACCQEFHKKHGDLDFSEINKQDRNRV